MTIDDTPRTLVLVAFPPEWAALAPLIEDAQERQVQGRTILLGMLSGLAVILAETGVSMVNAAMTTQALIDRLAVERIVVSGIAGGIDPALAVGDVVVPAAWGQFLEVGMGRATGAGFTLPPLPGATDLPAYGMMMPRDVLVATDGGVAPMRWIPVDADLLALARALAMGEDARLVVGGRGTSGTGFVDHADYRRYLLATFGAQVVDMESAAIAQVAFVNAVPCIVFRALSDLAGGEVDDNALPAFMARASENAARAVAAFLSAISAGRGSGTAAPSAGA